MLHVASTSMSGAFERVTMILCLHSGGVFDLCQHSQCRRTICSARKCQGKNNILLDVYMMIVYFLMKAQLTCLAHRYHHTFWTGLPAHSFHPYLSPFRVSEHHFATVQYRLPPISVKIIDGNYNGLVGHLHTEAI